MVVSIDQINVKTPNPKGRLFLKIGLQRDFAAPTPLRTPYSPLLSSLHTVYVYTIYLFTQGRGGGELTREKVRGAIVHKASRKYQHD
jgi:hypothetical protein